MLRIGKTDYYIASLSELIQLTGIQTGYVVDNYIDQHPNYERVPEDDQQSVANLVSTTLTGNMINFSQLRFFIGSDGLIYTREHRISFFPNDLWVIKFKNP